MQLRSHRTHGARSWQRSGLRWLVTFAGFPLGGLLAELVVGPVDSIAPAVVGGALTGLVLGAVQAWALAPEQLVPKAWVGATAVGFAIGLGVGAAAVDYGTGAGDLAIQGAICGFTVGAAQALVLRNRIGFAALAWPPALAGIWALGWTITTAIGVDVEQQYTVFGSSGAITVTVLTAALPIGLALRALAGDVVNAATNTSDATTGSAKRWLALSVLCVSLFAIVLDNTIVNVALPTLVRDLDADISQLQWVVDAYTLVFAGLLLLAGTLGDRYGRRRTLLLGLAVFGAGSAAAAFAGGVDQLVIARAVMGAGAAFIMPATLSLLTHVFTDSRERAVAIGIWAATAGAGVALGPVLGGILLDHFWWGSIFIVNVPVVAVAIVAAPRLVPESRDATSHHIDWLGAALSAVGLVALVWAVIEAPVKGWGSPVVVAAFAVAIVALGGFVAWQRRAPEPLLDLRLFRNASFSAASGTIMLLFFALFGFLFLSTQYLQFVLGYTPSAAGVRMLPYAGAMIVAAPLSAKLAARFGVRRVVTAGMLCFASGLVVAATITTDTGYGRLAIAMLAMGVGMGLAGTPATESIMSSVPPDRANVGSAVNDTTRELGGALGVAIVGSIVSSLYGSSLDSALPAGVPAPLASAARESVGAAVQMTGGVGTQVADAARDAFVHAMSRGTVVVAIMAGLGALLAWRFLPSRVEAPVVPPERDRVESA